LERVRRVKARKPMRDRIISQKTKLSVAPVKKTMMRQYRRRNCEAFIQPPNQRVNFITKPKTSERKSSHFMIYKCQNELDNFQNHVINYASILQLDYGFS
jgi:hypothetical protein